MAVSNATFVERSFYTGQQQLKTTFTSVNEKNKFAPAKEVNGFRVEDDLQHPFGDDVSTILPLRSSAVFQAGGSGGIGIRAIHGLLPDMSINTSRNHPFLFLCKGRRRQAGKNFIEDEDLYVCLRLLLLPEMIKLG